MIPHLQLTGEIKVQFNQSKTKDNVDHAGLSPPLLLWRVLISLKLESFLSFQSNNLLIAIPNPMDVTVVLRCMLLSMLRRTLKNLSKVTHTPERLVKLAKPKKLRKLLRLLPSLTSQRRSQLN